MSGLSHNHTLRELDLRGNQIELGAVTVATMLKTNRSLEGLDLSGCGIGSSGGVELGAARGVTRTILGGFTKRNFSLGEFGGMLPQKQNFENYYSTNVNSGLFFLYSIELVRVTKIMLFEHVLHGDDLSGVHRIMQKLHS